MQWLDDIASLFGEVAPYLEVGAPIASAIANYQAAKKQDAARRAVLDADRQRQAGYQQQADTNFNQMAARMAQDSQNALLASQAVAANQRMAPVEPPTQGYLPTTPDAPKEVKETIARQYHEALNFGKARTRALAQLSAYGGLDQGNKIAMGRAGQDFNRIQNFSRGSSGVIPLEMQGANEAGGNWRTAGEALGGLGTIASIYGATQTPRDKRKPAPRSMYDPQL